MAMLTMPSCKEYARCMTEAKVCLVVFGTELCDESDNIFFTWRRGTPSFDPSLHTQRNASSCLTGQPNCPRSE